MAGHKERRIGVSRYANEEANFRLNRECVRGLTGAYSTLRILFHLFPKPGHTGGQICHAMKKTYILYNLFILLSIAQRIRTALDGMFKAATL